MPPKKVSRRAVKKTTRPPKKVSRRATKKTTRSPKKVSRRATKKTTRSPKKVARSATKKTARSPKKVVRRATKKTARSPKKVVRRATKKTARSSNTEDKTFFKSSEPEMSTSEPEMSTPELLVNLKGIESRFLTFSSKYNLDFLKIVNYNRQILKPTGELNDIIVSYSLIRYYFKEIERLISQNDLYTAKSMYKSLLDMYEKFEKSIESIIGRYKDSTEMKEKLLYYNTDIPQILSEFGVSKSEFFTLSGGGLSRLFRKISFQYHPDKISSLPEQERQQAEETFKSLAESKTLLNELGYTFGRR